VVDNTFASPFLQQPLALGAQVVVHSTTKYLSGHSDVLGGPCWSMMRIYIKPSSSIKRRRGRAGPLDCWLTLRGVKTLAVRMRQHTQNAQRIAEHLAGHPRVHRVVYPGLASHPQHKLAREQMSGFGAIVTFEIEGGREAANAFVRRLKIFIFAESLAGWNRSSATRRR